MIVTATNVEAEPMGVRLPPRLVRRGRPADPQPRLREAAGDHAPVLGVEAGSA